MGIGIDVGVKRITTQEANIKTATVEVKALTIAGKQVTLSVFRQLQDEDLIDPESGQLNGVPWGRINYYWGECQPPNGDQGHLHVVWQKGKELRRACLFKSIIGRYQFRKRSGLELENLPLLKTAIAIEVYRVMHSALEGKIKFGDFLTKERFDVLGYTDTIFDFHRRERALLYKYLNETNCISIYDRPKHYLHKEIQNFLEQNDFSEEDLGSFQQQLNQFQGRWQENYQAVASTDHLFIAV